MKKSLKSYLLIIFIIILSISCSPKNVNGKLSISSNPTKAKVYIDNEYKGITPLELELRPKNYDLKLTMDGYKDYLKTINIEANKTLELQIILEKEEEELQKTLEGKWELVSYKGKEEDVSIIGFEGTLFNFFKDGSFQNTKLLYFRLPIEHTGEYKIIDDSHIKLIYELVYTEIYKFYFKEINNLNCLFLSDENDSFTVVFIPYTEFDYEIDEISEHILGTWLTIYDHDLITSGYCTTRSFDEYNNFGLNCWGDDYYGSYSLEDSYLYINIESRKIKCKVKELSFSRLMLDDEKDHDALFVRNFDFGYFESNVSENSIYQIYSQVHSGLRNLCTVLEMFKIDWGKYPIQTTPLRLTENNVGAELLGNNKAKINIKGKKSLMNENGPIKYIEQLPIDPLSPNRESYYYQSNSDGSKWLIYSFDNENKKYIFRNSLGEINESDTKPTI